MSQLNLPTRRTVPLAPPSLSLAGLLAEINLTFPLDNSFRNIALLDIASMHPSSIIAETLFGPEYTKRFQEIRDARVAIKRKDFEKAKKMLNGALAKYLTDEGAAADLARR